MGKMGGKDFGAACMSITMHFQSLFKADWDSSDFCSFHLSKTFCCQSDEVGRWIPLLGVLPLANTSLEVISK